MTDDNRAAKFVASMEAAVVAHPQEKGVAATARLTDEQFDAIEKSYSHHVYLTAAEIECLFADARWHRAEAERLRSALRNLIADVALNEKIHGVAVAYLAEARAALAPEAKEEK